MPIAGYENKWIRNKEGQFINKEKIGIKCPTCHKIHLLFPSDYKRGRKYCSTKCADKGKSEKYRGQAHWNYQRKEFICEYCNKKFEDKPSKKRRFCSSSCSSKSFHKNNDTSGKNSPTWKGGLTSKVRLLRNSLRYTSWRLNVFKRDNYRCRECGKDKFVTAHHVIGVSDDINLIFDVNNGITLCIECHQKKHPKLFLKLLQSYKNWVRVNSS